MINGALQGNVEVRIENNGPNSERRIYLTLSCLPGWLLGMIRDAGPLRVGGCGGRTDQPDRTGPQYVCFQSDRVFVSAEPVPRNLGEEKTVSSDTSGGEVKP